MPFVRIKVRQPSSTSGEYEAFCTAIRSLPAIIAEELSCNDPGGSLTPSDVEVEVAEFGPLDISNYNLELHIEAMRFPSRVGDKQDRGRHIFDRFVAILEGEYKNACLWLKFLEAEFVD